MRTDSCKNIDFAALSKDYRMLPLCNLSTIVSLRLWVLKVNHKSWTQPIYRITYGLCTLMPNDTTGITASQFNRLCKIAEYDYSTAVIKINDSIERIVNIINGLLHGKSLVTILKETGTCNNEIPFDISYTFDSDIRPIIFNKTFSRSKYHNPLLSPYNNASCFSLSVWAINKKQILALQDGALLPEWESVFKHILERLQSETNIEFTSHESSRLGNLELINAPSVDKYEQPLVSIKQTNKCHGIKVLVDRKAFASDITILTNCTLSSDGQTVLNECHEKEFSVDNELEFSFDSLEQFGEAEVAIWIKGDNGYHIWHCDNLVFCLQVNFSMGIVGLHGAVKSDWLEDIKRNASSAALQVQEAEKIERVSYTQSTIGEDNFASWTSAKRQFDKLYKKLYPERSKAEFFPKGWDNVSKQHGQLSFLEWFKKHTEKAEIVILQDPYFDSKALEFIARGKNTNTQYMVFTQTQLATNSDGTNKGANAKGREGQLLTIIQKNPTIFSSVRMKIYDVGGANNVLHDRYLLLHNEGVVTDGFLLSNSIQGATKKQPLLITPIPADVLIKVDDHVEKSIKSQNVRLIYDSDSSKSQIKEPKNTVENSSLFNELKTLFPNEEKIDNLEINTFLSRQDIPFNKLFATFGYCLAHTSYSYKIVSGIDKDNLPPDFTSKLSSYLKKSYVLQYPLGFVNASDRHYQNNYAGFFTMNFEDVIRNVMALDNIHETYAYSNWSVLCGTELLLKLDRKRYINLLKWLHNKVQKLKGIDYANTALHKLANTIMGTLLEHLAYYDKDMEFARLLIKDKSEFVKSMGALAYLYALKIGRVQNVDIVEQNLPIDTFFAFCITGLLEIRCSKKDDVNVVLLADLAKTLESYYDESRFESICEQILLSYGDGLKCQFTDVVVAPLVLKKILDADHVVKIFSLSLK